MALDIHGTWELIASASMTSEIAFVHDAEPDPTGVARWLNGFDAALIARAKATSGLVLSIAPDGAFTEVLSGAPQVYWFDVEGVLQAQVTPFNGVITLSGTAAYLRPTSIAPWATPVEGRYAPAILRYDDGDTQIADRIQRVAGKLVRTVNVVTDALYLDRVVIIYEPARGAS